MDIYLPLVELSLRLDVILMLGMVVGFISTVFGVGGGFISTPFLIFLGVPPVYAVGTQAIQLMATSLSGFLGHWSRQAVDIKLGTVMLAGSLAGTVLGVGIFHFLRYVGQIDAVINILYVLLLGGIGLSMFSESVRKVFHHPSLHKDKAQSQFWADFTAELPFPMHFPKSDVTISLIVPVALGVLGGLMVSLLGIGGGFLLIPAMVYIIGVPSSSVVGTSLYQILITTTFAAILQATSANSVDGVLAFVLMCGGLVGSQIGGRVSSYVNGVYSRFLLALILLGVSARLAYSLFVEPSDYFSIEVLP